MANIEKLKFPALKITGAIYIAWITNVELYLEMKKLTNSIKSGNKSSAENKAEAIIFLRQHLDENVTHDYAHIKDPAELWQALKERFDNQREVNLPHALEEWKNLRFQDFQKVADYNSAMLRIVSQLKYCGHSVTEAEMLEKTYLMFHKEQHVLPKIYRRCGYTKFSELIVTLILAEKNDELLIKNHNSRPTGAKAFPEVNATTAKNSERNSNLIWVVAVDLIAGVEELTILRGEDLTNGSDLNTKEKETQEDITQKRETVCYRCGCKGHWSPTCRTSPHLCKLYKESLKGKAKEVNLTANFAGTLYLDSSDFENELD